MKSKVKLSLVLFSSAITLTACQAAPANLNGYWESNTGGWIDFLNDENMDILTGGTFTSGSYKVEGKKMRFRVFGSPTSCSFKLHNAQSFTLSSCGESVFNGRYRYTRSKR